MPASLNVILAADPAGGPYLAGIIAGFAIGAAGHLFAARVVVVLGIAVILLTTVLFLIASDPTTGSY